MQLPRWELDPAALAEMRYQQEEEIPYLKALRATFGKGADWRVAICLEAKRDQQVRNELAWWLAKAVVEGDADELMRFQQAVKTIKQIEKTAPVNRAKALAILFVLRYRMKRETWAPWPALLPTEAQVRQYLIRAGSLRPSEGRKNEARDIFNGPILGTLPKGKPGRKPKSPSSKSKT